MNILIYLISYVHLETLNIHRDINSQSIESLIARIPRCHFLYWKETIRHRDYYSNTYVHVLERKITAHMVPDSRSEQYSLLNIDYCRLYSRFENLSLIFVLAMHLIYYLVWNSYSSVSSLIALLMYVHSQFLLLLEILCTWYFYLSIVNHWQVMFSSDGYAFPETYYLGTIISFNQCLGYR